MLSVEFGDDVAVEEGEPLLSNAPPPAFSLTLSIFEISPHVRYFLSKSDRESCKRVNV